MPGAGAGAAPDCPVPGWAVGWEVLPGPALLSQGATSIHGTTVILCPHPRGPKRDWGDDRRRQ